MSLESELEEYKKALTIAQAEKTAIDQMYVEAIQSSAVVRRDLLLAKQEKESLEKQLEVSKSKYELAMGTNIEAVGANGECVNKPVDLPVGLLV